MSVLGSGDDPADSEDDDDDDNNAAAANADAELHCFFERCKEVHPTQSALATAHQGRQALQHYQFCAGCAALPESLRRQQLLWGCQQAKL